MTYSNFLRTVLKYDAASCLGMAALLLPFADGLAGPLGISSELLTWAGAALIPIGLFIGWLGVRGQGQEALVWLVILGNLGWVAASFGVAANLPGITPAGTLVVVAQSLTVLLLSVLEARGLRMGRAAAV